MRLRLDDTELFTLPVDVFQPQAGNLAGTQSIGCQQKCDGVVAKPNRSLILIYVLKDCPDLIRSECLGHVLEPVQLHARNSGGQIALQVALIAQETKKVTQTTHDSVSRRSPESGIPPSQEAINGKNGEFW